MTVTENTAQTEKTATETQEENVSRKKVLFLLAYLLGNQIFLFSPCFHLLHRQRKFLPFYLMFALRIRFPGLTTPASSPSKLS